MSDQREVLLEAHDLRKSYQSGDSELQVLRGINMTVRRGEIVSVVGLSGVGKSTLLNILGLLDNPSSGSLTFHRGDGSNVNTAELGPNQRAGLRNEFLGFVFQFYHLLPDLNVLENVLLPTMISRSRGQYRLDSAELQEKAQGLLTRVGVVDRHHHRPSQLSGGERQRVAIARALINEPRLLLCDEPTGNLDTETSASVHDLFQELNGTLGTTTLIVTHDPSLAKRAERTLTMVDGVFSASEVAA